MVSITVPVYPIDDEVTNHFIECIRRIKLYTSDYQLIVVQNGGEHLLFTPERLCDNDIVIYTPKPLGFAKALNMGLRCSSGDYLALVSADVYVQENWFEILKRDLDKYGPGAVNPTEYMHGAGVQMDVGWGAAWLTTRTVIDRVGLHDEKLNHRFSDQDFWIRMKMCGYQVFRSHNAKVQHFEGSTVFKMPGHQIDTDREQKIMLGRYGVAHFHEWVGR